jgi:hypothetical protein
MTVSRARAAIEEAAPRVVVAIALRLRLGEVRLVSEARVSSERGEGRRLRSAA